MTPQPKNLDPNSPRAATAAALAREMLSARATEDSGLLTETLVSSLMAVLVDQELLPYLLAAQSFLAWTVVIEAVVNHRDPDGGDEELTGEDLDQEVFRRLEILFRNMADAGLTIA